MPCGSGLARDSLDQAAQDNSEFIDKGHASITLESLITNH
jgi:hypothetical protein